MTGSVLHAIELGKESDGDWISVLSPPERARAEAFAFESDRSRWTFFRAALRRLLGSFLALPPSRVPIELGEFGKPALAIEPRPFHFSLSHSDRLMVVLVSEAGPVGVDLEPWTRGRELLGCEESFCHPEELRGLPLNEGERARQLLEIWTAKEALLKALGTGLSHPPQDLRIRGASGTSTMGLPGVSALRLATARFPAYDRFRVVTAMPAAVTPPLLQAAML